MRRLAFAVADIETEDLKNDTVIRYTREKNMKSIYYDLSIIFESRLDIET
jgi:hypothetical protein